MARRPGSSDGEALLWSKISKVARGFKRDPPAWAVMLQSGIIGIGARVIDVFERGESVGLVVFTVEVSVCGAVTVIELRRVVVLSALAMVVSRSNWDESAAAVFVRRSVSTVLDSGPGMDEGQYGELKDVDVKVEVVTKVALRVV